MNVLLLTDECFDGDRAVINNADQLSHIKTVLKSQIGDVLKIGRLGGCAGVGVLTDLTANQAILTDVKLTVLPPNKTGVTIMLALPRPKVLRRLIMDMTAMGVNHIILVNSARTDKSYWGSPILSRLDEFVIEGLQQGVDTIPPTITLAKRFKPFVQDELPSLIEPADSVVCHPYAAMPFGEFVQKNALPTFIAIGAEGGFVPYEIERFNEVGIAAVSLGERILRTESAVNAVLGRYLS
ncbi:16S rRNA (uracil(1498)-N(3))-methyltransferase [Moraxella sp. Tifton1]|uniref:16S rRNA (uracil(1498)-N(3))-methyltransferase n=1 Tax=Moraxella oculi TaxID=2940516 RepID=UPI002010CFDA|nr:16S rRNA (uracil(1498)-N(3))-methyltransferase [Moraxella sp. Tifton1]MCL1623012.1 16S rRNA (uracil(1498)-N(3))-methyltransferase [Moraxella sp. Tifton1]